MSPENTDTDSRAAVGVPPETSGWVSVRCVFRLVRGETTTYEERITLWRTTSMDEAVHRAEQEALAYAADLDRPEWSCRYVGLAQAYLLSDAPDDGAEIYSLMRGSDLEPEAYLDAFFDTGSEHARHIGTPS